MSKLLGNLQFVLCYLDDIMVFSRSKEEHELHVRQVLGILQNAKLYAEISKCFFFKKSVSFLGHVVSNKGVHVDPTKVQTI